MISDKCNSYLKILSLLFSSSRLTNMAAFGVSNLRKFKVLTWKTLKIKARHFIETTLDLLVPTLLFIIVVVLRYELLDFAPTEEPPSVFPAVNDLAKVCGFTDVLGSRILYSPMTEDVNKTMEGLKTNWNFLSNGCGKERGIICNFEFLTLTEISYILLEHNI